MPVPTFIILLLPSNLSDDVPTVRIPVIVELPLTTNFVAVTDDAAETLVTEILGVPVSPSARAVPAVPVVS